MHSHQLENGSTQPQARITGIIETGMEIQKVIWTEVGTITCMRGKVF
jgi:hypothetical protein